MEPSSWCLPRPQLRISFIYQLESYPRGCIIYLVFLVTFSAEPIFVAVAFLFGVALTGFSNAVLLSLKLYAPNVRLSTWHCRELTRSSCLQTSHSTLIKKQPHSSAANADNFS